MKDFYYILGTDEGSSLIEIKEAYRKLSKKFHPDLNQNDKYFETRFREIQEAYETLSDPAKRARYDAALKRSRPGAPRDTFKNTQYSGAWAGKAYHATTSTKSRPKTRALDIGFTIILFILTLIFGDYVLKSVRKSNDNKVSSSVAATSVAPVSVLKHHKRRHNLKITPIVDQPASKQLGVKVLPAPVVKLTQPVTVESPMQAVAAPVKPARVTANYLYATDIISNASGVTNMRGGDSYSSAIIKVIPNHSQVKVLQKGDAYYKVLFDNATGYVPKWALEAK